MYKLAIRGGPKAKTAEFMQGPIITEKMKKAISNVLYSGKWGRESIGTSDTSYLSLMEEKIQKQFDTNYVLGVANCTGALEIALHCVDLNVGDEVIVTPYSYVASATCILHVGAKPVFVDIDPNTWNIDLSLLEKNITKKTKAIVVVHFGGQVVDMNYVRLISNKYGIKIVEDAAHAFGAEWNQKKVGTLGDVGCFSFQQSKNITAGEGGIIVTNNEEVFRKAYSLHMAGRKWGDLQWYRHYCLGWNYRMTEFQAALIYSQLFDYEEIEERRRRNAQKLSVLLSDLEGIEIVDNENELAKRVYHLFALRYNREKWNGLSRKRFVMALSAEGVPCSEGYGYPIYKNPLFVEMGGYEKYSELCPVAESVCKQAIWLPHYVLAGYEKDIEEISNAFHKICENINELI